MAGRVLEICVDDAAGLQAAIDGGADRIELCSALALGGLTPTPGLMALASKSPVPVYAMIRPRSGDFVFSATEIEMILAEIDHVRACGLAGIVIGISQPDGRLDGAAMQQLVDHAHGLGVTLHRAFDLVPDFAEAIDTAVALGCERILTSGGARTVLEGIEALDEIVRLAAGRISIMPGSGVTAYNAAAFIVRLGVTEIHSSGSAPREPASGKIVGLGFDAATRKATDAATVATLKDAVSAA